MDSSDPPANAPRVREVGDGFWNIRGSFHIGPVDIGTQASLSRLTDGRFVFLDGCALDDATRVRAAALMGQDGPAAIVHLHPFHTLHVRSMASMFPEAKLYGTARHHRRFPELPWAPERTEDPAFAALFADDFTFSVPRGVAFVPSNENLHFASVLALHKASRVLHVDDTIMVTTLPKPLRALRRDLVRLHPTLRFVLDRRAGAAAEFSAWTDELIALARDAEVLCAAHAAVVRQPDDRGRSIADRVAKAVRRVRPLVERHQRRFG